MNLHHFVLGPLRSNCYICENKNGCVIIDPGDETDFLLNFILSNRLNPVCILATHGHFDHIGAVGEIQMSFDIPLYISRQDGFLLKRVNDTAKYFLGYDPCFLEPKNIIFLDNENQITVGNFEFRILTVPGHTPGSILYLDPAEKYAFIGDTIFEDGIGRTDFSYSSAEDMLDSIQKILQLPDSTLLYPGHGGSFYVKDKKQYVKRRID
ncbi:MAG: MBL fold metallo-hydrolase [Candidatus Dojkabacteria bacterium]|nr:MBL fold metallo-hydrolase [Candidatus Dojkabacteria bacterium]